MKRILCIAVGVILSISSVFSEIKYVFYFIGDGMGINQVIATEMYRSEMEGKVGRKALCMSQFPYSAQALNYSASNAITCSAAAGTALATGYKTNAGCIGVDASGKAQESIAAKLKKQGWGVGIMTSVSIDHATPASFYAHQPKRSNYYEIGKELTESGFDFFGGASFLSPEKSGWEENLYSLAEKRGYTFARGLDEAEHEMDAEKMILIQQGEGLNGAAGKTALPPAIHREATALTLPQITYFGLHYLSRHHKKFFMMVEGGAVDWSCHNNDAATVIHEMEDFDEAIQVAYDFYKKHPDETLIVVTADHETGGLALGNSDYTLHLNLLQHQSLTSSQLSDSIVSLHKQYGKKLQWEQVKQLLQDKLGLYSSVEISEKEDARLQSIYKNMMRNRQKDVKTMYSNLNQLSSTAVYLLNKKAHLAWTTHSHTASAVPVFAIGAGAERFTGWMDNTEIMPRMLNAAGY